MVNAASARGTIMDELQFRFNCPLKNIHLRAHCTWKCHVVSSYSIAIAQDRKEISRTPASQRLACIAQSTLNHRLRFLEQHLPPPDTGYGMLHLFRENAETVDQVALLFIIPHLMNARHNIRQIPLRQRVPPVALLQFSNSTQARLSSFCFGRNANAWTKRYEVSANTCVANLSIIFSHAATTSTAM